MERYAETAGVDNWRSQPHKNHCIVGNAAICEKIHRYDPVKSFMWRAMGCYKRHAECEPGQR